MLHDGWSSKWKAQRINTASYCDLETCRSVLTRTKALSTLMPFRKRVLFETFSYELGVSCYQTRSVWKRSPEWILSPFSCYSGRRKRLCSSKTLTTRPFLFFFQFELMERKRARTEYEKMLFRQEMEAEELRVSSESALKELQQLQVSCSWLCNFSLFYTVVVNLCSHEWRLLVV